MRAARLPDDGEITVTATLEEWQEVVNRLNRWNPAVEDAGDKLVYWLIYEGVYE